MVQTVFPIGDAFFQDNKDRIQTAKIVQEWFSEIKDALLHLLWPPHFPDINVIEPLEKKVRDHFTNFI